MYDLIANWGCPNSQYGQLCKSCSKVTWRMNGRPSQTKWPGTRGGIGLKRDIQDSATTPTTRRESHPFTPLCRHDGSKESTFLSSFFITRPIEWTPIEAPLFFFLQKPNRLISKLLVGGQQANDSYIQECKHNKFHNKWWRRRRRRRSRLVWKCYYVTYYLMRGASILFALPLSDLFI